MKYNDVKKLSPHISCLWCSGDPRFWSSMLIPWVIVTYCNTWPKCVEGQKQAFRVVGNETFVSDQTLISLFVGVLLLKNCYLN